MIRRQPRSTRADTLVPYTVLFGSRLRRRLRGWTGSLAAAAVLVLAVGAGWRLWDPMQPPQRYATAIGQQHDVALEDGSRVRLDTNSALVVRYSRKHRDVVLERGRAQFDVAHAPQRPFPDRKSTRLNSSH